MKVRVEIHLTPNEIKAIEKKAKEQGRSRKNYCENVVKESVK